jgi:hypothetical protein
MIETKITDEVVESFSDSLFSFLRYNTTAFMDEGRVAVTTSGVNVVVSQTPSLLKQFVRLGATKGLPIIGGVFDYAIMSAQGEESRDAVVTSSCSCHNWYWGWTLGAAATGAAIGSVIPGIGTAIGFTVGVLGSIAFDYVWDNWRKNIKVEEVNKNIVESLKGFVSGFNCLGSVFG